MFKKACFLLALLLLMSSVYSIRLVEPISKELEGEDFVGSIVPGQELELIVSKELGKFDSLEITSTLPENISVKVEDYLESIKIFIKANEESPETNYSFSFIMKGIDEEEANVFFTVNSSLLDASFLNYSSETFVDEKANYEFILVNNSYADAEFEISTNLPWYWLEKPTSKITVPKRSTKKASFNVIPQIQGDYFFVSNIQMQNKDLEKSFTLNIISNPTFVSKFSSPVNGLPFYSISLLPSYLINGLISFAFN